MTTKFTRMFTATASRLAAFALAFGLVGGAWGATLTVGSSGADYPTLAAAFAAVSDGDTIEILADEVSEGSIAFPTPKKNVTVKSASGVIATLKNMVIRSSDGNSVSYEGITFDGIVFDNSRLLFIGQRVGEVVYKDWAIVNCTFKNIVNGSGENYSALHFGAFDAEESLNGLTFTNNVIDGVEGTSPSGLLVQRISGAVTITGNTIKNVAYNAIQIQNLPAGSTMTINDNYFQSNGSGVLNLNACVGTISFTSNAVVCAEGKVHLKNLATSIDVSLNYWGGGAPTNKDTAQGESVTYSNYYQSYNLATRELSDLYPPEVEPVTYVAQIVRNDAVYAQYETLAAAFAVAADGDTIELLANVELSAPTRLNTAGMFIVDGKGFTISPAANANFAADGSLCFGPCGGGSEAGIAAKKYTLKNATLSGFGTNEIIRCETCSLTVDGCTFTGNALTVPGYSDQFRGNNMILFTGADAAVTNCVFTGNTAARACIDFNSQGGGNNANYGVLTVTDSIFRGNSGLTQCVVYSNGSSGTSDKVTGSTFEGNSISAGSVAVIYCSGAIDEISGNLFTNNVLNATSDKCGIMVLGSKGAGTAITDNAFVGNSLTSVKPTGLVYANDSKDEYSFDVSGNYWGTGVAATVGANETANVCRTTNKGEMTNSTYATAYAVNENGRGVTVTLYVPPVAQIISSAGATTNGYANISDAISAISAGCTLKLLDNAAISSAIAVANNLTVDLNGFTLTSSALAFNISAGTLTLTGGGTLVGGNGAIGFVQTDSSAVLELAGVEITATGSHAINIASYNGSITVADNTVNTVTATTANKDAVYLYTGYYCDLFIEGNGTLIAHGARFGIISQYSTPYISANVRASGGSGGFYQYGDGYHGVRGIVAGLYSNDVSANCADGYVCIANTDAGTSATYPYAVVDVTAFNVVLTKNGAQTPYDTIEDALSNAGSGAATITVYNDVAIVGEAEVAAGQNITFIGGASKVTGTISVAEGGSLKIKSGKFTVDPSAVLDYGYTTELENGVYTVVVRELEADSEGDFHIYTLDDLAAFRNMVNENEWDDDLAFLGDVVILEADIDMSPISNWTPIGTSVKLFAGDFQGGWHKLTGMTVVGNSEVSGGLFRTIASGAEIHDLRIYGATVTGVNAGALAFRTREGSCVDGVYVDATTTVTGSSYAAGLVAVQVNGNIYNCWNYATVTSDFIAAGITGYIQNESQDPNDPFVNITNCVNKGTITGVNRAGGIVAHANCANVSWCFNAGAVSKTSTTESMPAGGIVGVLSLKSVVSYCLNTGTVTCAGSSNNDAAGGIAGTEPNGSSTIKYCDNTGTITADLSAAGIAGPMYGGTFKYCRNSGTITANTYAGGILANPINYIAPDSYCVNDAAISAANVYTLGKADTGGYYYEGNALKTAAGADATTEDALAVLNGGEDDAFWLLDDAGRIITILTMPEDPVFAVAQIGDDTYETFAAAIDAAEEYKTANGVYPIITVLDENAEQSNPDWKIADGKLVHKEYVAQIGASNYESLAEAIAAAYELTGDVTVSLLANISERATIWQKQGLDLTIDGEGRTLTGQLIVLGLGNDANRTESLTIKNLNFTGANDKSDFLLAGSTRTDAFVYFPNDAVAQYVDPDGFVGDNRCHAHNVTISNCTFAATGESNVANLSAVAIKSLSTGLDSINLVDVTVESAHSIQLLSLLDAEITRLNLAHTKNGINLNFTGEGTAIIRESSICPEGADSYGIRLQGPGFGTIRLSSDNVVKAYEALVAGNTSSGTPINNGVILVEGGSYVGALSKKVSTCDISVTGGIFSADPSDYVAIGYAAAAIPEASDLYAAGYRHLIGVVETTGLDEQPGSTETNATYEVTTKVIVDGTNEVASVAVGQVSVKVAEEDVAGTTLSDLNMTNVLAKAVSAAVAVTNGTSGVGIDVALYVAAQSNDTAAASITFEVHPKAVITVKENDAPVAVSTNTLSNADLAEHASFKFRLYTGDTFDEGATVKVTHRSEGVDDEVFYATVQPDAGDSKGRYVLITTTYFSTWTLEGETIAGTTVAVVFGPDGSHVGSFEYATFAGAVNAATNGCTVLLVSDVVVSSSTALAMADFTIDADGHAISMTDGSTLNITGGRFTSVSGLTAASGASVVITGGVFDSAPAASYFPEGYAATANPNAATRESYPWAVGRTTVDHPVGHTTSVVTVPGLWIRDNLSGYADENGVVAIDSLSGAAAALAADGANGIPVWQSYVLGLSPATALRLSAAPKAGETKVVTVTGNADVLTPLPEGVTVTFRLASRNADGTWTDIVSGSASQTFDVDLDDVAGKVLCIFADVVAK